MNDNGHKIANSFYLPKHPFLHGIARMMDFTGALNRGVFAQVLERSDADSIRADWEAVGASMRWALAEYEGEAGEQGTGDSRGAG